MTNVKDNDVVFNNIPEKTFQDSQKTTEQVARLSERAAKAEAEVAALKEKIKKDEKKITVTLKTGYGLSQKDMMNMLYGISPVIDSSVSSIKIDNVDEVDKFLTSVLESDLAKECDELKDKYEKLEAKLDEKDIMIKKRDREINRLKEEHGAQLNSLRNDYFINKNAIEIAAETRNKKNLAKKDVDLARIKGVLELERQNANLREVELLNNLDIFKKANAELEKKVAELKEKQVIASTKAGKFLQSMIGYRKAEKKLKEYNKRNPFVAYGLPF